MKYYLGTSLFNVNQPIFLTQWGYHSHGESRNLSPLGNASPARGWWHRCSAWSADNSQADSMLSSSSWPEAGWAWAKTLLKSTTGNTPLGSTVPEQAETRSFRPTSGISNGSQGGTSLRGGRLSSTGMDTMKTMDIGYVLDIWWVVEPPLLKYDFVSWDDDIPNWIEK